MTTAEAELEAVPESLPVVRRRVRNRDGDRQRLARITAREGARAKLLTGLREIAPAQL